MFGEFTKPVNNIFLELYYINAYKTQYGSYEIWLIVVKIFTMQNNFYSSKTVTQDLISVTTVFLGLIPAG